MHEKEQSVGGEQEAEQPVAADELELTNRQVSKLAEKVRKNNLTPQWKTGKQTWEDETCQEATSCDSPRSQNSAAPEALNMC
ncbi:hypothetical protein AV530_008819 [Patagioenas fasciata monilis]|uniref:Uncharacterized protein n=1 Tax=Patagioenas fasciata monilis TaxID=372326 RepID=A0A1V4JTS0_PATFA|nr:hypothetical protein AV530_008819 [Patagioenas fasciata monilis]